MDIGIYENNTFECRNDIVEFGGVGLQELPACRNIEEEIAYKEVASYGASARLLSCNLTSCKRQLGTDILRFKTSLELHLRNGSDRRKSLATEAHGG